MSFASTPLHAVKSKKEKKRRILHIFRRFGTIIGHHAWLEGMGTAATAWLRYMVVFFIMSVFI